MNAFFRIVKSLKLKNEIVADINGCIKRRNMIKENVCRHCGSNDLTSNGYKINSKGNKVPRYKCNYCNKTFYLINSRSNKEYTDKPLDLYGLQIRKEYEIFKKFLKMYLRVEYERILWRIIKDKGNPDYEYAKRKLYDIENKTVNKDVIEAFHNDGVCISKRTTVRWRNKIRAGIEGIVEKYSDTPLDDDKWFCFLKEANRGYGLRSVDSNEKKIFDEYVICLILLAEDIKMQGK